MNNWSITDKIYLYISYDESKVSIANPEAKKYWGPVQKNSESITPPLSLDNNGQKIKLSNGKVFLEVNGKYIKLDNLYEENILSQLSEATFTNGEAIGVIFGFSQYEPDKTILIFPGSSLYKKTEEEFLRKVSLSLCKKTSKYIPGHRYDTGTGSFWYIGSYISKRNPNSYTKTAYGKYSNPVHVFSNFLPISKKVSDIFQNYNLIGVSDVNLYSTSIYKESMLFTTNSKSMVDMGKELDIDIFLEDSYDQRLTNYLISEKTEDTLYSKRYFYKNFMSFISIFDITPDASTPIKISENFKKQVKEIIKANTDYILHKYYDTKKGYGSYRILTSDSIETQISNLDTVFAEKNLKNNLYYNSSFYGKSLLKELFGVELNNLFSESIKSFIPKKINTFSDYLENIGYFENRSDCFHKIMNFIYSSNGNLKFSKHLPDCPYSDLIKDICKKALDTNGSNLDAFGIENVGTIKKPLLKYTFTITLKDILRHYGLDDINSLPDSIKKDLVSLQIYDSTIITRSDITIAYE